MTPYQLHHRILQAFPHQPTEEQLTAIDTFTAFLCSNQQMKAMILRGCAGTGKTTLVGAIVRALTMLRQTQVLMAPTGRAAKVMSLFSGHTAFTIHRRIYRQKVAGTFSAFTLSDNRSQDTLFIVDECSMIANSGFSDSNFGSGRLLDDLMQYVFQGRNCSLLLVGDSAQLPPVGEEESPALQTDVIASYGAEVYEADLLTVVRQSQLSGILFNATLIRQLISSDNLSRLPPLHLKGFADIHLVSGNDLIESLASSYAAVGIDETMVVTRSNKRANIYNQGIRARLLDREERISSGDLLMVVKNNYHWAASLGLGKEGENKLSFIANGDRALVRRVRHERQLYGFTFVDLTLRFPDYDDQELTATVVLDSLTTEAPALTHEQQQHLYEEVMADYADIPHKKERMDKLKQDIHYNALQVKFGYAVTCHKAQGGQWEHIYIDQGYLTDDMLNNDYIHWLYTAFTRATSQLFLVNWKESPRS